jgi:hypothetical protein
VKRRAIAVAAAAALAAVGYLAWPSDPPAVQWLKDHPGGTLTGQGEITYARRDGLPIMIVTFTPTTAARPDCPANKLCLYAAADYGYPRAVTEACGYVDLRRIGWARRARSIHNNLPGGDYEAGTVAFYRSDGGEPSAATEHRVLTLDPAARTTASTQPAADWLYHRC